jgi:signal transduction histidine kinase
MKILFKSLTILLTLSLIPLIIISSLFFSIGREELQKEIGENSVWLAHEILDKIDRNIYSRVERLQAYSVYLGGKEEFRLSNEEFDRLDDIQTYIDEKDNSWTAVPKETITPFMQKIIDNSLSVEIKEELESKEFYNEREGYEVFSEIFATNKYGANIVQTQKTSDYYQADEEWWQIARETGLHISDVEFDESAGVYSINVGVRIDDKDGNFLGVMKTVLNIEEVVEILKEVRSEMKEMHGGHATMEFKLVNKDAKIIYSSEEGFEFCSDLSKELFSELENIEYSKQTHYFVKECEEEEELFAYANSEGYKNYEGLGWILVVEHETEEIFAPIQKLKDILLIFLLSLILLIIFAGLAISRSFSKPIIQLKDAAIKIGKGEVTKVNIDTKDEIQDLADTFNYMSMNLKHAESQLEDYSKDLEKKIRERTKNLEKKTKESEDAKKATMNVLEDVEETRKKLEKSYEKLKELDVLKTQFLSMTSHELKTPLTPIRSQLQRLLKKELPVGKRNDSLKMILRNAIRLERLIDDVLEVSRIESQRLRLTKSKGDLNEEIKKTIDTLKQDSIERGIKINTSLKKLPAIYLDKDRMEEVIFNLTKNAIDHSETKEILVSSEKKGDNAVVSVADRGKGISKDEQVHLFELFYQGKTKNYGHRGTGLGLAIVKGIVEAHGGKVWVKSELKKGSTFYFSLPIKRGKELKSMQKKAKT